MTRLKQERWENPHESGTSPASHRASPSGDSFVNYEKEEEKMSEEQKEECSCYPSDKLAEQMRYVLRDVIQEIMEPIFGSEKERMERIKGCKVHGKGEKVVPWES